MRLTRQLDEAAGFWAEAVGDMVCEVLDFAIRRPKMAAFYSFAFFAALAIWQLDSWGDLMRKHFQDEYFYAYVERVHWRVKNHQP